MKKCYSDRDVKRKLHRRDLIWAKLTSANYNLNGWKEGRSNYTVSHKAWKIMPIWITTQLLPYIRENYFKNRVVRVSYITERTEEFNEIRIANIILELEE